MGRATSLILFYMSEENEEINPEEWIQALCQVSAVVEEATGKTSFSFQFVDGKKNRFSVDIRKEPDNVIPFPAKEKKKK
jgi:hypothetical protein